MTSPGRNTPRPAPSHWAVARADVLVLGLFVVVILFTGLRRTDFIGDGMRHIPHILDSSRPALGEPRWLLFPLLLFVLLKPFVLVGAVASVPQAARVFCLFDGACGFIYLLCLRRWLRALDPLPRAALLLLAGASAVFLTLAADTMEPTAAVCFAVAGLTFAKFRPGLRESARLLIAATTLALASLVYQGILFGFFFLPAIFSWRALASRRNIALVVGPAVAATAVTIAILCLSGDQPANAVRRYIRGEANPAASDQYSRISARNAAGILILGPAYAFASIPDLRGLAGTVALLRRPATMWDGVSGAAAWIFSALAILTAMGLLIARRQPAILLAYAGMMFLPALRMSQYGYPKYYVLLPLLVVLAVPRLGVRYIYPGLLGLLLLVSNATQIEGQRQESAQLAQTAARDLAARTPPESCFLTNGWGVPLPNWRGDFLAWKHILNGGVSGTQQQMSRANSAALEGGLEKIFCGCKAVVTDTFTQPNLPALREDLSAFGIANIPIADLVVGTTPSAEVFHSPAFGIWRYSPEEQRHGCEALTSARSPRSGF